MTYSSERQPWGLGAGTESGLGVKGGGSTVHYVRRL